MRLLLKREKEANIDEHTDAENLVSIKIKGHKNGFGAAEMLVTGNVDNEERLELFKKALLRFEEMPNMKHYLDLGGVERFSADAALETLSLVDRMSGRRSLFGIVDVSAPTSRAMTDIGAFEILREAYLGDYRIHNLPAVAV